MSQTDSFIDEVTEEVRRDRLFALMRRYGWIAIALVLLLVGGAAYNEWTKAQARAKAEALGDSMLNALQLEDDTARAAALSSIEAPNPAAAALVDLLAAAELANTDAPAAATRLLALADNAEATPVYRQIATLKAVTLTGSGLSAEDRRSRLEGLALGTGLMRMLAEEQLAYLDIQSGDTEAAMTRLQQIVADATVTPGLRRRASQVIVALGGELPDTPAVTPDATE